MEEAPRPLPTNKQSVNYSSTSQKIKTEKNICLKDNPTKVVNGMDAMQ